MIDINKNENPYKLDRFHVFKFYEFDTFIKFPDNEILGKEGRYEKVKTSIQLSKVYSFYESCHEPSGEKGTGIEFKNGSEAFITESYRDFKKLMNDYLLYYENN